MANYLYSPTRVMPSCLGFCFYWTDIHIEAHIHTHSRLATLVIGQCVSVMSRYWQNIRRLFRYSAVRYRRDVATDWLCVPFVFFVVGVSLPYSELACYRVATTRKPTSFRYC